MGIEKINELRKQKKLSLDELSEKSGISKSTLSKITSGQTKNPNLETVQAIARALNVPVDYFDDSSTILPSNGDLSALREQLRRQPGMRILFDAGKNATEQDLLDAAALIEGFKRRRDGEE
jgi:transcriptional regulator with XRE-family HTH domain